MSALLEVVLSRSFSFYSGRCHGGVKGSALWEYALVVSCVCLVAIASLRAFGGEIQNKFQQEALYVENYGDILPIPELQPETSGGPGPMPCRLEAGVESHCD